MQLIAINWLLFGIYHPPSQADIHYFNDLDKALGTYSSYEKRLLIGDFKHGNMSLI